MHAKRIKFYDPLNSPEDPEVYLSREDDADVADREEVLAPAQDKEAAQAPYPSFRRRGQQVAASSLQDRPQFVWQAQARPPPPQASPTFLQLARMHTQRLEAESQAPPLPLDQQLPRDPSVGVPLSHQRWLSEQELPRNAFPSDV